MIPETLRGLAVPVDGLEPYRRNPRQGDVGAIVTSLERHGQYRPIVVNARTQEVLAGNHTLAAARQLGWSEIAATFVDVDEDTAARIVLVDNRSNDLASYDDHALAELLRSLPDLDGTGYSGDDLDELLAELDLVERPSGDTEPMEPPDEPRTRLGDLYLLGEHRLLCGNATVATDLDDLAADDPIGLVYTDPPYGVSIVKAEMVGADFGVATKGRYRPVIGDESASVGTDAYALLAARCERIILWGGNYFADRLPPTSCWLVWDKRGDTGIENTFADVELAWTSMSGPARCYRQLWNGMIREGEHDKRSHPTQKPVGLAEWAIGKFASNGSVLDVFAGSGSTLIACENLGRRCYAMELDPGYCDVIVDRYERHTGKTAERSEDAVEAHA